MPETSSFARQAPGAAAATPLIVGYVAEIMQIDLGGCKAGVR